MKTIGRNKACVVYLGSADFKRPRTIERAFEEIVKVLRRKRVVLDFSGVSGGPSLSAGAVILANVAAAGRGVSVKFAGLKPQMRRFLRKLGVLDSLDVHETVEAALESFEEE